MGMKIGEWEVELSWPAAEAVGKCLKNRADLLGSVKATLNGKCRSARLPMPYEGVFLVRNYEHGNLELLVWNTLLISDVEIDDGKHGVRKIPSGKKVYAFWNFLEQALKKRIAAAGNDVAKLDLDGLVPVRWLKKKGFLQRVRPQNPLELLASINGVRRYAVPREVAARYGIDRRLNQGEGMAFEGRICPIETPESELVGIQLQLARGARVCPDGTVEPAQSDRFLDRLGWGAALIPFVNCNDSARNTVGAKNLRQALVVEGREAPLVQTGVEQELVKRMKPLMDAGVCPSALDRNGKLALGCNLLVAYMPWFGWNIEDAMVVSESAARKLCVLDEKGDPLLLKLGDKLTGRHGNKGVVSRILPDAEMPHLPNGEAVEIILNPHGIISRMNPGQLLETHLGWLYHAGVRENEVMQDGAPRHSRIRELLKSHGLDDRGRVQVSLPGGESTENPVVVGYQYFVRLNHIPGKVAHSDRTQHLGEMEVWALAANEANVVLGEMLGDTFNREFRDWLLVLGIGMERTDGGVKFKYLDDEGLMAAMQDSLGNAPREVAVKGKDAGYEESFTARYQCRNSGCDYRLDAICADGGKSLKMDDFLRGLGVLGMEEKTVTHKPGTGTYRLSCKLPDGQVLAGYCQRRGKDDASPELGKFSVCCPNHPTTTLIRCGEVEGRKLWPRPGGLFDAAIFPSKDHWGCISLKKPGPGGRKIVPVLPLKYRRMLVEGRMDDLSAAYAKILDARGGRGLEKALGELEALVKERLFGLRRQSTRKRGPGKTVELGKKGLVRRHGLGREVDHAARQVIVPNPELEWNEVGVPRKVYQAMRDGELPSKNDLLVLNRQPSLHRHSMQALYPKVMDGDEDVFQISPLVCGGFAADFDGDAMVAHYPVSDEAQEDARKMLPEENLVSTANGAPMVHFKLDFKSGAYLLGKGLKDIEKWCLDPKRAVKALSQLAREAFADVTLNGASFGFYDFLDRKSGGESAALKLIYDDSGANGSPEQMKAILERLVEGMGWKEFFQQSDEGRRRLCGKKLNSGKAGGLTRRLVLELWPRQGVDGLRAAQAIGERALQLTQSSVHGGGLNVDGLRKMLLRRGRKLDRSKLPAELNGLQGKTFDVWDKVFASGGKVSADAMTRLAAGRNQFEIIEELAKSGEVVKLDSPFGKVLFNAI